MVEMRALKNASYAQLAEAFQVSENTVRRVLTFAKKANLIAELEDDILQQLVPAAQAAITNGLKDGEHTQEAAKLGLEILKLVTPKTASSKPTTVTAASPEDDLSSYIARLRADSDVIEGAVEGATLPALSAAETAPLEEGHDGAAEELPHINEILAPRAPDMGD